MLEGFYSRIGELRVVKKLVIKSSLDAQAAKSEIELSEALGQCSGIVRFYGWCNSQAESALTGFYSLEVYLFFERGVFF